MSQYLISRKNDNDRTTYYKSFDGRKGVSCAKSQAPRFDKEMADRICRQLAATDNRGWNVVEDAV